jgi:DNA-directed RNA polymerase subunit RPC12/RpoP
MTDRPHMSFGEKRAEIRQLTDPKNETGVRCSKCGRRMTAEKTIARQSIILRYRECMCGHKVITSQAKEVIVREVQQHDAEPNFFGD